MLAKPGTTFVSQPDIPVPLAVGFPFPAWAARPSEKGEWAGVDDRPSAPADPFAAIPGAHDDPPAFWHCAVAQVRCPTEMGPSEARPRGSPGGL
jgi:hypothetical protein